MTERELETEVLIIGGGVTGTGVMRDLALRGIHCLLIDRRDLNAGASGGNHGLLHSGGRYVSADTETAAECRMEGDILKNIASEAVDSCGGIFTAVEGDDTGFVGQFAESCAKAGITCTPLTLSEACEIEPTLSEKTIAAFQVPDASVDPFRLTLANVQQARLSSRSDYLPHMQIQGFEIADGLLTTALCRDTRAGENVRIRAKQFVNASGVWSRMVAELAGCSDINLLYSKGTLIISNARMSRGVINRLRPPGNGDILVPGGTVSILGTTSDTVDQPDTVKPTVAEVDELLSEGSAMVPALQSTRFIRAFTGVRPLIIRAGSDGDGRSASRGFSLHDHEDQGLGNFATITGGKLTTFRLMAEKTGDLVAARLKNTNPSNSATTHLPSTEGVRWTEPGYAARYWFKRKEPSDLILCECEMVPQSAVREIIEESPGAEKEMTVKAIAMRSRIGKGTCQGAFCSMRVTSELYDQNFYKNTDGLRHMREFVTERYKGVRPVLWGEQMPQIELAESMHCGLMGLDLLEDKPTAEADKHPAETS